MLGCARVPTASARLRWEVVRPSIISGVSEDADDRQLRLFPVCGSRTSTGTGSNVPSSR